MRLLPGRLRPVSSRAVRRLLRPSWRLRPARSRRPPPTRRPRTVGRPRRLIARLRPVRALGLDRLGRRRLRPVTRPGPLLPICPLIGPLIGPLAIGLSVHSCRCSRLPKALQERPETRRRYTGLAWRVVRFDLFDVDGPLVPGAVDGFLPRCVLLHLGVVPEHELLLADPSQTGDDEIDVHTSRNPNVNNAEEQRHEFLYLLHLGVGGRRSGVPGAELTQL